MNANKSPAALRAEAAEIRKLAAAVEEYLKANPGSPREATLRTLRCCNVEHAAKLEADAATLEASELAATAAKSRKLAEARELELWSRIEDAPTAEAAVLYHRLADVLKDIFAYAQTMAAAPQAVAALEAGYLFDGEGGAGYAPVCKGYTRFPLLPALTHALSAERQTYEEAFDLYLLHEGAGERKWATEVAHRQARVQDLVRLIAEATEAVEVARMTDSALFEPTGCVLALVTGAHWAFQVDAGEDDERAFCLEGYEDDALKCLDRVE